MNNKWPLRSGAPIKLNFGPIESDFFTADELGVVKRRRRGAERQAVGFGDIVHMIGGDHAARARHVLHQDRGIAGNMFSHAARVSARKKIVGVAGQVADDDAHGLALVEVRLREYRFKVQRVQKFNDRENQESENLERLNL